MGEHGIQCPGWAPTVFKASVTSGSALSPTPEARGPAAPTLGWHVPSQEPRVPAHLGSRTGQEGRWADPSIQKGTSRVASTGLLGTAKGLLEGDGGPRSGSGGLELQPGTPAFYELMTTFPLII